MPQTTTLIATARNEGPFLLEWVAYHRAIGFDQIVILSDVSQDGTETLLDKLAATRAITHIPKSAQPQIETKGFRNRAYAHALSLPAVQQADWVMVLDIDEYLNIHVGTGKLKDLLGAMAKRGHSDVISLGWRSFGNAGQAGFINRLLLPRFTRAAPAGTVLSEKHLGVKSLFRPAPVVRIGPHRPRLDQAHVSGQVETIWRNGSGEDVTDTLLQNGWSLTKNTHGSSFAQINRYAIRSNAVFALHHLADPPLTGDQKAMTVEEHTIFNTNHVTDTTITRWAQATIAEIKRLQSFPGVQNAHKETVAAFEALIAQMQAKADPGGPIPALLDPVATKAAMAQQIASVTKPSTAPETAGDMHMVAPDDLPPAWLADLRRSKHRRGWYYTDDTFAVQMTTRSAQTLVVSFDAVTDVAQDTLARNTAGYGFYRDEGWSHMGVMAFDRHWFRDQRLFNFLEGQVKTGLFKRFARVLFTGTGMGGYAATAFAGLAPGCSVLAFAPQSTLDPGIVPWEDRFGGGRQQDWSGRYTDATTQIAKAKSVYLVYDPYSDPDKRHAARYQGANVVPLKSWYSAYKAIPFPEDSDLFRSITTAAINDTLTPASYYQMYRKRRTLGWYTQALADHVLDKGHRQMATGLARYLRQHNRDGVAQDIENRL